MPQLDTELKPQAILNRAFDDTADAHRVELVDGSGSAAGFATAVKQDTQTAELQDIETDVESAVTQLQTLNSLIPSVYDSITLSYTGTNLTGVVFKLAAATVSTLTLAYTGSRLDSVAKS